MTLGLVKWDDQSRNSRGEDDILEQKRRKRLARQRRETKSVVKTDAELRKHREQKGLETPVVYAVNHVH